MANVAWSPRRWSRNPKVPRPSPARTTPSPTPPGRGQNLPIFAPCYAPTLLRLTHSRWRRATISAGPRGAAAASSSGRRGFGRAPSTSHRVQRRHRTPRFCPLAPPDCSVATAILFLVPCDGASADSTKPAGLASRARAGSRCSCGRKVKDEATRAATRGGFVGRPKEGAAFGRRGCGVTALAKAAPWPGPQPVRSRSMRWKSVDTRCTVLGGHRSRLRSIGELAVSSNGCSETLTMWSFGG